MKSMTRVWLIFFTFYYSLVVFSLINILGMRSIRFWPHTPCWYEKYDTGVNDIFHFLSWFINIFPYKYIGYEKYAVLTTYTPAPLSPSILKKAYSLFLNHSKRSVYVVCPISMGSMLCPVWLIYMQRVFYTVYLIFEMNQKCPSY